MNDKLNSKSKSTITIKQATLDNSVIVITGGTGSFGHKFLDMTLKKYNPKKIIVFSRDEMKQWEMQKKFSDPRVRFFIGDVRDRERLYRAFKGVDHVIHAAATKIVPTAEYNPFECVKTNVLGAMNVIDAAIDNKVQSVVALSTDKASGPVNLYGATKLVSDKLFVAGNHYSSEIGTKFAVVRYGNVMGSRGSVIPLFMQQKLSGQITVTDPKMTRFMITLSEGVKLVWLAFQDMVGGEIYIKKIPSMRLDEIASVIAPKCKVTIIGNRPGEKIHEQMISPEDAEFTYEYDGYFKILPQINNWYLDEARIKNGIQVPANFSYQSDKNPIWMSKLELQEWIDNNNDEILAI